VELRGRSQGVRKPSTELSFNWRSGATQPQSARTGDVFHVSVGLVRTAVDPLQTESEVPFSQDPILLSSDTEDDICKCNRVSVQSVVPDHCQDSELIWTSLENRKVVPETDFYSIGCSSDVELNNSNIQAEYSNTEEGFPLHIKSDDASRSHSFVLRSSSKRKRASAAVKTYKQGNIEEVSQK